VAKSKPKPELELEPELVEVEPNTKPRRKRGGVRTNNYETVKLVNGSKCPQVGCKDKYDQPSRLRLALVRRMISQNRVERQIYCPVCAWGATGKTRYVFHEPIDPTRPVLMPAAEPNTDYD
jgi:hypothetical protein